MPDKNEIIDDYRAKLEKAYKVNHALQEQVLELREELGQALVEIEVLLEENRDLKKGLHDDA